MSRIVLSALLTLLVAACGNNAAPDAKTTGTDALPAAISETRDSVASKPVASFRKRTPNDLNDWYFSVELFETPRRFDYLLKMEYEETNGKDTVSFPNLGLEPKPELRQGKTKYSCVIGFLDKEGNFREYKEVSFASNRLKVTTLKYYAVSATTK